MRYFLSTFLAFMLSLCAFGQPMSTCGDPSVMIYHDPILCTSNCAVLHANVTGETPIPSGITGDDQYSAVLPIGFTFNYYGIPHTQCIIGSNGMINFDLSLAGTYDPWPIGAALLGNTSALNAICGPWCDIFIPAGGTITYATSGVAPHRRFTATWCNVPMYHPSICPGEYITTQIILYECCDLIDVQVTHKTFCPAWNGGYAIIGVQNAAGTLATVAPGRNFPANYNCNNEAWRFTPLGPSYAVAATPYCPVPNAASVINWYQGAMGGPIVGTGPTLPCANLPGTYRIEVAGCGTISTAIINLAPRSSVSYDTLTICLGGSAMLPALPTGGHWIGGSAMIATINPLPYPGSATGVGLGSTVYTYTYGEGCEYRLTINVISCTCHDENCNDTCYWTMAGNTIHSGRNMFGTLSNDNIRIVTNNTDRAVIQAGGYMGIRQLLPSTTLDVDCMPTTAPSGLQFENLPFGHGNVLVVDPMGYVYVSTGTSLMPGSNSNTELQDQINQLKQRLDEMTALLNPTGDNSSGTSLTVTPNPTNGQISASYTIAGMYNNAVIKITDNQGRLIASRTVTNNTGSAKIDLPASLASGELIIILIVDGKPVARQKEVLVK